MMMTVVVYVGETYVSSTGRVDLVGCILRVGIGYPIGYIDGVRFDAVSFAHIVLIKGLYLIQL